LLPTWSISLMLGITALAVLKLFQVVLLARFKILAKRTKTDIDDIFIEIISSIRPGLYVFLALYIGLQPLSLAPWIDSAIVRSYSF